MLKPEERVTPVEQFGIALVAEKGEWADTSPP
jgi:hypothetical protein